MRSDRQLVATHGNGFRLSEPFSGPTPLPPVATALLFLKKGGLSSCRCWFTSPSLLPDGCSSLSWRWTHTVSVGAVSASQFHKGPSGGQSQAGACRDRGGAGSWRGLEGFV